MATDQQRLRQECFEATMGLLGDAVFRARAQG
jgi:hypothetical protein